MEYLFVFNELELILLGSLGLLLLILIGYQLTIYTQLYRSTKRNEDQEILDETLPPLSIVICSCNESENLKTYLPFILEQSYPQFEVIVVNDGSTDQSEEVLMKLEELYPNLYHTFIPEQAKYLSRIKLSLTVGIKATKHDIVVFTDANCKPASLDWLRKMGRHFKPGVDIVLGYNSHEKESGFLRRLISFDALFCSMRYLGMAILHKPYMGLGRNMAYRKQLFFDNKGFSSHLNLLRGEDDLFINKVANETNTVVEADADAVIWVKPVDRIKIWVEEKVCYAATANYYKGKQHLLFGFETTVKQLFYFSLLGLFIYSILGNHISLLIGTALLGLIYYVIQLVVVNKSAKSLQERRHYLLLPLYDWLLPYFHLSFRIYRLFRGKSDLIGR